MAGTTVSLVLNVVVLMSLAQLAFPRETASAEPKAITVDLVPEPPKPAAPERPTSAAAVPSPANPAGKSEPSAAGTSASSQAKPTLEAAKPSEPTPKSEPAQSKEHQAAPEPPPAAPPAETVADPASASLDRPAAPPPIEGNAPPAPRLVAAPEDPRAAATQSGANVAANAETKPAETAKPTEHAPQPAPDLTSTTNPAADAVSPPATTADTPAPAPAASAEQQREAENTAKLAAALPFAQGRLPDFSRAALSGTGDATAQRYRGEVYGAFRRADDLVSAARAQHLRGQTVVEFEIDDQGGLTNLRVAISSGNPAVDRTALDIIRRSAPFPAPPPGGQHVFSPAIRLGMDD